ncbi:MAG: amidase [Acidimicrobiales bacterium]
MSAEPWLGDACGLVEEFRAGTISPLEALEGSLAAMAESSLNAFSHVDAEQARATAATADVGLPFGGVPFGVKELEQVAGWPFSEATTVFADRVGDHDATSIVRLRASGAVLVAQTAASELGGANWTSTEMHGTTRNPWDPTRTPGGSSGGTAAAVAGGLLPIATGSDGGGSIRIPAGYAGLFGLKATYGRIPKGPRASIEPLTAVMGCLSRSVRDTARYFDACNGYDSGDPLSLPRVSGWEAGLGTHLIAGRKLAILPGLGIATLRPEVRELVASAGEELAKVAGLEIVEVQSHLPPLRGEWSAANQPSTVVDLGASYPESVAQLGEVMRTGLEIYRERYSLERAARVERFRRDLNDAMAELFDAVDFVVAASTPDVAFVAEGPPPLRPDWADLVEEMGFARAVMNNAALTAPSNLNGSPAMTLPLCMLDGLPIGVQVLAAHHREPLLLELALAAERGIGWPSVAPGAPC